MSNRAKAKSGNERFGELKKFFKGFLCRHFDDIDIDDIFISRHVDDDGFEFLHVRVILTGEGQWIDPRRSVSVNRHVRPLLEDSGEKGFPVISYIDKVDIGKADVAAFV